MYLGKVVELSPAEELYVRPIHPYTTSLLSAIPIPDPKLSRERNRRIPVGELPSPINPPPGCRFNTRCPFATEVCATVEPPLVDFGGGHLAACHHPRNVSFSVLATATRSPASPVAAGADLPDPSEATTEDQTSLEG
jgi:oligopeptide/dipeptide ABC transporter ATP-binding protein